MADAAEVRFAADAMLGSLARKLRIFGFDTYYHRSGTDASLMDMAERQKRVILTADRALHEAANRRGVLSFFISGRTDAQRLRRLAEEAGRAAIPLEAGDSRCAVCNGVLRTVERSELLQTVGTVKKGTRLRGAAPGAAHIGRHRRYFICSTCGKVYWRGSHWSRLRRLSRLLARPAKEI